MVFLFYKNQKYFFIGVPKAWVSDILLLGQSWPKGKKKENLMNNYGKRNRHIKIQDKYDVI